MKTFYFVGGPKPGRGEEFFQRLAQVGGIAFKPFSETYGRYSVYLNVTLK